MARKSKKQVVETVEAEVVADPIEVTVVEGEVVTMDETSVVEPEPTVHGIISEPQVQPSKPGRPRASTVAELSDEEKLQWGHNKSEQIRALHAAGRQYSEISQLLGVRYQHVRNVLAYIMKRPIKAAREAERLARENGGE